MKFFDKRYHTGKLSDLEFDDRADNYARHIKSISLRVKPSIAKLIECSFHDALVCKVRRNVSESSLEIVAVMGDLQKGYSRTLLQFEGAKISSSAYIVLLEATQVYGKELLDVEYQLVENDVIVLSGLFSDFKEFTFSFSDVLLETFEIPRRTKFLPSIFE
jgi:hypothetical protein